VVPKKIAELLIFPGSVLGYAAQHPRFPLSNARRRHGPSFHAGTLSERNP